jgi:hypothetical protein
MINNNYNKIHKIKLIKKNNLHIEILFRII